MASRAQLEAVRKSVAKRRRSSHSPDAALAAIGEACAARERSSSGSSSCSSSSAEHVEGSAASSAVLAAWKNAEEEFSVVVPRATTTSRISMPNAVAQSSGTLQVAASGSSEFCAAAPRCQSPSAAQDAGTCIQEALQQQHDFLVRNARADMHHHVLLVGAIANIIVVTFATHAMHTHGISALASAHPSATLLGLAAPIAGFALSRALQPDLRPSALSAALTSALLVVSGSFVAVLSALLASVARPPLIAFALCAALLSVAASAGWALLYVAAPSTSGKLTSAAHGARAFDGGAWRESAPLQSQPLPKALRDASPSSASSRRKQSAATTGRVSPMKEANANGGGCCGARVEAPDADAPRTLLDASRSV